jgi:hypothetical protein
MPAALVTSAGKRLSKEVEAAAAATDEDAAAGEEASVASAGSRLA